jgi:hypothetical protein
MEAQDLEGDPLLSGEDGGPIFRSVHPYSGLGLT